MNLSQLLLHKVIIIHCPSLENTQDYKIESAIFSCYSDALDWAEYKMDLYENQHFISECYIDGEYYR